MLQEQTAVKHPTESWMQMFVIILNRFVQGMSSSFIKVQEKKGIINKLRAINLVTSVLKGQTPVCLFECMGTKKNQRGTVNSFLIDYKLEAVWVI